MAAFFSRVQSGELVSEGSFTPEAGALIEKAVATGRDSREPQIRAGAFSAEQLFSANAHPEEVIEALQQVRDVCARLHK